jgi:hypothetical protein
MAFVHHDDRTYLELIQLCYRRWLEEAIPENLPTAAERAEGSKRMAELNARFNAVPCGTEALPGDDQSSP